jgi:hypothetical protein
MRLGFLAVFGLLVRLCYAGQPVNANDVTRIAAWMSGAFDSRDQHLADTANYFAIRLHMKPIWKNRADGVWLYVEQAMMGYLDKPYRQRVYHVYLQDDSTVISHVYEMEKPLRFAGVWQQENPLSTLTPDSLKDRKGCSILLRKTNPARYLGQTHDRDCLSTRSGATYATSEVVLEDGLLVSWDRGWDADGKQVWGATQGGYRFVKREAY